VSPPETPAKTESVEEEPASGGLKTLIYGTKAGKEMEKEHESSFSQAIARGKYVHSIVFHDVKPDKVDEYVKLVGDWYPKVAARPMNKVHLVGSWRTEVGDCDTFGELPALPPLRGSFRSNDVQYTFGNTSVTRAITNHSTPFSRYPSSPSSIASLRVSSTPRSRHLCKSFPSGPQPLLVN